MSAILLLVPSCTDDGKPRQFRVSLPQDTPVIFIPPVDDVAPISLADAQARGLISILNRPAEVFDYPQGQMRGAAYGVFRIGDKDFEWHHESIKLPSGHDAMHFGATTSFNAC